MHPEVIGKYRILRLIGQGGMASVYEAEHEMLGSLVAVKVLNPLLSTNNAIRERFRSEARIMASLNHQNIVRVIDFDEQPQQLSIVMELLEGEDLNRRIRANGPLTENELIPVFRQVLSALQYAHDKGVVHRDIKPSNIFLLPDGQVKILDFGIAKVYGQGNELTVTGQQIGTPVYMSPEQVRTEKSIDHRTDIYSLGVTMFFAAFGKPPYDAGTESQFDILTKIVHEPIPAVDGGALTHQLIQKACAKDRTQRFQQCREWLDVLEGTVALSGSGDATLVSGDRTIVETTHIASIIGSLIRSKEGKIASIIGSLIQSKEGKIASIIGSLIQSKKGKNVNSERGFREVRIGDQDTMDRIGIYRIFRHIGEGGMADVYLAEHDILEVQYAIKVLKPEYRKNETIKKRFLGEAKNLARMNHPNIVKVSDMVDTADVVAFVMEYIEGQSLKDYMEQRGKLRYSDIQSLFTQMLEAVGYVHGQNLIHRDIKPSNFMMDRQGKVKLLDFGIAKNLNHTSVEYTLTQKNEIMGTVMYMSPEQVKSTKAVANTTDIYSLGVVLWQMVEGEKPYDAEELSMPEIQYKIIKEPLPLIDDVWDGIIQKATSKHIEDRYARAEDFSFAMAGIGQGQDYSSGMGEKIVVDSIHRATSPKPRGTEKTEVQSEFSEVRIGDQVWMTENLKVDQFRNGDVIPEARSSEEWMLASKNKQPAWCYYDNDPANGAIFGKLYNWYAVNDPRGLAPEGWHVPTDAEWTRLTDELGGDDVAAVKLKSNIGWDKCSGKSGNGSNISGFSGRPGGKRVDTGICICKGEASYWWSITTTDSDSERAEHRSLDRWNDMGVMMFGELKGCGFSVRCLRV